MEIESERESEGDRVSEEDRERERAKERAKERAREKHKVSVCGWMFSRAWPVKAGCFLEELPSSHA